MSKINIMTIKEELAAHGWALLSQEYQNLDSEISCQCPEGHEVTTTWKKIRKDFKCPVCALNTLTQVETIEVQPKPKGVKRVLALDQASHVTGYSIFDNEKLIKYGTFTASKTEEIARFATIKQWLISMIETWNPDCVGIEGIQFQDEVGGAKMGVTVFQTLARLQGILLETCYEKKINYQVCPTNTWRHYCGVKGRARTDKKRSMQLLVKKWYDVTVTDDEADAIGIGHYLINDFTERTSIENWET